ncbi:MAG: hypothetical protein HY513_04915 [Candidatus Aenigmarchaeota archaeon]|nr:hypothetical protein [Candidatus Aenigmarchaeota archaeon]
MIIKMVLTVMIILALVFTFVSYFPVSGLLTKAGINDFKFSNKSAQNAVVDNKPVEEISAGNISFELKAKKYSPFSTLANGQISIKGATVAEGNGVSIDTRSLIRIKDYYGFFSLNGLESKLNGSLSNIYMPDATFKTNNILLASAVEELDAKYIEGKELRIAGVLGTIKIKDAETAFTGTLVLTNAVAELNLDCLDASAGCELVISGNAASLEIPEAGLRFK